VAPPIDDSGLERVDVNIDDPDAYEHVVAIGCRPGRPRKFRRQIDAG
jgi:hypothetical protein